MKNITIENIVKVCEGRLYFPGEDSLNQEASSVVIDSRQVTKNSIFIAVRGERVDGHSFISEVFQKKALAVICQQLPPEAEGPCILVEDTLKALRLLAGFYRRSLNICVIGITGSVGKTSTKEFIAGVLSARYRVWKTLGNFNNEIGLPLTILGIREHHELAVLEMGISDFGEMHRLSEIAAPDYCVLTNIGQCHLENLKDRDGVLKAKSEIFDYLNPEGRIYINGDDDKLITLKEKWKDRLVTFGRGKDNDLRVENEVSGGLLGTVCDITGKIQIDKVKIGIPGEHMVLNALAATAVALELGLNREEILIGMTKVERVSGRSNVVVLDECLMIDDCYNANPVSMKAAIDLLQWSKGRRIAILGDMFELGDKEEELHYGIGVYAADKVDVLICIGSLSRQLYCGALEHKREGMKIHYLETKEGLYEYIKKIKQPQDTFLIKASHGMGFSEIVSEMEKLFPPKITARDLY